MSRYAVDRTCLAACLILAISTLAGARAFAFDISTLDRAAGVWEISRDGGARKCSIQLRAEKTDTGNALGLPPSCRLAMPLLANVASWKLATATQIDLLNRAGIAILTFRSDASGLAASGPGGETYALMTAIDVAQGAPRPGIARAAAPVSGASAPPAKPADIPGRYAVLRDGTKDTGCMLTLQPGSRAQLAPACRDNGFVVFDPQSWAYSGGKLRLTARKGHAAMFEHGPDGSWQKDPKEGGKPLGFRKM